MGKSEVFVRESIKNGSLPIGSYTQKGDRASFYISPKRAYEWLGYRNEEDSCYNADASPGDAGEGTG